MSFDKLVELGKQSINSKKINRYFKCGDCVCVIESKTKKRYIGYSYSFSNFGYCAEQSALISMFNNGEYEINKIVTISKNGDIIPPCGRCLELISQTINAENIQIALSKYVIKSFLDVYPYDWKRIENYNLGMPLDKSDPYNIKRFVEAQKEYFDKALEEIKNGKKESHWISYIFPMHKILSSNVKSDYYGISSISEAKEYFANKILRENLITISNALLSCNVTDLTNVVGANDCKKIHSCITLFCRCTNENIFTSLLVKYYRGEFEPRTNAAINEEIEK